MSAADILAEIKQKMSDEADIDLREAYKALSSVVKADVSLAPRVFDTFETALKSEKNTSPFLGANSLRTAYESLSSLVEADTLLTLEVLAAVNTGLRSEKNNCYCLGEAYKASSSVQEVFRHKN